ncbi:MAG TPA: DUF3574 domain-containing protein [Caulobacteraceae bacterium]|nr:DUF3574 domain-containing protein [Caulobacteraceae bacterium]
MRRLLLATAFALFAAPALAAPGICPQGLHAAATAELFFAQDLADGRTVSNTDWRAFLAAEVRPRFPTGLAADVYGEDQGGKRAFQRLRSQAVFLVLTGAPDERQRLDLVRDAYNRRFHTDPVLLIEQRGCAAL